ncbi:MAG: hypothetical protein COU90_02840 [Candidatus Ryanbacteria bacterium CG10_big_fil_rev_8_21_14_0_10_43_42]|uniref:Uncharacterized protein n=1 Tax=Candidatus Ryanbacteria bacterium CG10_big_fil_rev_8_21_14_0_10_43_42 TaxID=1974864 RepID=A0A2M8KWP9_9BACT|nr:MAG: hypothetical protein COU90_02840 [Candidatus Ryanbacteria bacterium CG10_big_fil_rev_8_21_14_0_10_43_42]
MDLEEPSGSDEFRPFTWEYPSAYWDAPDLRKRLRSCQLLNDEKKPFNSRGLFVRRPWWRKKYYLMVRLIKVLPNYIIVIVGVCL